MTLVAFVDCVLVPCSVLVLQEFVYLSHVKYFSGTYNALSPVGAVLRFFFSVSQWFIYLRHLITQTREASNAWSSCLSFLSSGNTVMSHHNQQRERP